MWLIFRKVDFFILWTFLACVSPDFDFFFLKQFTHCFFHLKYLFWSWKFVSCERNMEKHFIPNMESHVDLAFKCTSKNKKIYRTDKNWLSALCQYAVLHNFLFFPIRTNNSSCCFEASIMIYLACCPFPTPSNNFNSFNAKISSNQIFIRR